MAENRRLEIHVSGYISKVVCGQIPIDCKNAFLSYLLEKRDETVVPDWLKRRNPNYVGSDDINRMWYIENDKMKGIMKKCGFEWTTFRSINEFSNKTGFASGKNGIGIFEMGINIGEQKLMEFVPFEPDPELHEHLKNIQNIKSSWSEPEPAPIADPGYLAVSSGTWAKGTALFRKVIKGDFKQEDLVLIVSDLTNIGIGEDYFVSGFKYAGEDLQWNIIREDNREMYQVSWYSRKAGRWLEMHELN